MVWVIRASWRGETSIHVGEMTQLGVLESKQVEEVDYLYGLPGMD